MRITLIAAVAGATMASTAASAADLAYPPPPPLPVPAEFGGWYLRGDVGFSNQSIKNIRKSDPAAYSQISSLGETTGFDTGGIFGVGVGYQFNSFLRADVTGQFRGGANFKGTDNFAASAFGVPYNGIDNYNATKKEWVVMANAYVDLGTWYGITPFVGAGVGAARVSISNFTDTGAVNPFIASATDVTPGVFSSYATAANGSRWNLAWAVHGGLAYKVTPNVTLEMAYTYLNLGDGTTGVISDFTGFQAGNTFKFKDITSQDLKLGVRWAIEPTPTYLPPPLITKG